MDNTKKFLLIDSQVLQTNAWTRGMGRYLAALIMGIYQNHNHKKVILVFNENFVLPEECKDVLKAVAPDAKQVFLPFYGGLSARIEEKNTELLDKYIQQESLEGSVFISGSIFSFDYAPIFPSKTKNTCIFYDMIPLKHWDVFYNYFPAQEYFRRYKHLYTCETIFSISDTVKQDLINVLGIREDRIVNISGAEIPDFLNIDNDKLDQTVAKKPYRYIFLPGGNSPHKNMLRAIRGFDKFNGEFGDTFKLVITSNYSEININRMLALSNNIVLTGNVPDSELHNLYKNAEIVMFPSLDEGLGLPILEAVGYDLKIACSKIPIFQEISKNSFYFFDPESDDDISRALREAITEDGWNTKLESYGRIKSTFTWKNSGQKLLSTTNIVNKTLNDRSTKRSIVLEYTGDMPTLKKLSSIVGAQTSIKDIKLYTDLLSERLRQPDQIPLIFSYFIPTFDISDAPHKAKKTSTDVILTKSSCLSIPVGLALKANFMGSHKEVSIAVSNFVNSLETRNDEKELVYKLINEVSSRLVAN